MRRFVCSLLADSLLPPQPTRNYWLVQARAQTDAAIASHQAQLLQQKAQNDAIHLQVKAQGEIELAKIRAAIGAKTTLLETHVKSAIEAGKVQRTSSPLSKVDMPGKSPAYIYRRKN